jgi:hypothetical protein
MLFHQRSPILFGASLITLGLTVAAAHHADAAALEWVRQSGTSGTDVGAYVSADGIGNVYIAGNTAGDFGGPNAGGDVATGLARYDVFLSKYDSAGNVQWTRQFGSNVYDANNGVSPDSLGNIFIAGITSGAIDGPHAGGNADAFVVKYDAGGDLQWRRQLGTASDDYGNGVSADDLGNVYIAGHTYGSLAKVKAGEDDGFLAKYDEAGNLQWSTQIGTSLSDRYTDVSVDGLGNVFVAGETGGNVGGPSAGGGDVFVAKYDAAGNLQWTTQFGSTVYEGTRGISADGLGNVYIAGTTAGSLGGPNAGLSDAFVAKLDAAGNIQWTRQLGSPSDDETFRISVDNLGNAYVAGQTNGSVGGPNIGGWDVFIAKYDASGNHLWSQQIGTSAYDGNRGVSADSLGNVYVSGHTFGTLGSEPRAGEWDVFLAKYRDVFPGDYNASSTVDAADYVVWRNAFGQAGAGLAADGNGDGSVNEADYDLWRVNFGHTMSGNLGAAAGLSSSIDAAVPEPTTIISAVVALVPLNWLTCVYRSRRGSRTSWAAVGIALLVAPVTASAALTDGLIGYWQFDGNGADSSNGGRDLTIYGNAGYATGLFDQALDLHGNGAQYAGRPVDDAVFDFGPSDFTVQIWVNYNTVLREQNLIEKFQGATGPGWTLTSLLHNGAWPAHFWAIEGEVKLYLQSSPNVQAGIWRQLMARRQGATFDLIYDGAIVGTGTNALPVTNTSFPLLIGRRNASDPNSGYPVDGRLDEAAIWNRALTNEEVAFLYNGGTGNPVQGTTTLAGDYNGNGTIDAADYVVWREVFGQAGAGLAADGNVDGLVDQADYNLWRAHFGQTAGSSATNISKSVARAPEPTTSVLLNLAMAQLVYVTSRRKHRTARTIVNRS